MKKTMIGIFALTWGGIMTAHAAPPAAPKNLRFGSSLGVGVWTDVTPAGVDLVNPLSCDNYGVKTVEVDPARPQDFYAQYNCQGIWKSTDYGQTWNGPINTGMNGSIVGDCAGAVTVTSTNAASAPTIYLSCVRGGGTAFLKSVDGGVDWTPYTVAAAQGFNQFYSPVVDPYDPNHLLMPVHGNGMYLQSVNGGLDWTQMPLDPGMAGSQGIAVTNFINTGDAATTRNTWLWLASSANVGGVGTWRTTNGGATWTKVDDNEHGDGTTQIYQPDTGGVLYMCGIYSHLGNGVLRSDDYGVTWTHVGQDTYETTVFGSPKGVYAGYGYAAGRGGSMPSDFQMAPQPGVTGWTSPGTPPEMKQGPVYSARSFDGTHWVFLTANYNSGVWRYVEP